MVPAAPSALEGTSQEQLCAEASVNTEQLLFCPPAENPEQDRRGPVRGKRYSEEQWLRTTDSRIITHLSEWKWTGQPGHARTISEHAGFITGRGRPFHQAPDTLHSPDVPDQCPAHASLGWDMS